jgi:hypothetical protein
MMMAIKIRVWVEPKQIIWYIVKKENYNINLMYILNDIFLF